MGVQAWTFLIVGVTFALYLAIAFLSRVKDTKGFYVAGQGVPALANGMATGADWMSAASFISMAGLISTLGYAGGVYLMGWTGGYVLLALLLAPYLRKFGHFTVPDFIGDRYASDTARLIAVVAAIFISFTYVVGQMKGVGVVFSRFLDVDITTGVVIGMCIVFVYATLGGMKGITWTQVAQYWVLITAFLVPAIAISIKLTGWWVPQIGLGAPVLESIDPTQPYLLNKLDDIGRDLGFGSYTGAFETEKWNMLNVFCVTLALMAGTAGLPHVIIRFYTVRTVKAARWSAFYALFFIALLYLTAPAVGAFARYYMIDPAAGLNGRTVETLPDWYDNWKRSGLIVWFDFNDDGQVQYVGGPDAAQRTELFKIDSVPNYEQIAANPQAWIDSHTGVPASAGMSPTPSARDQLLTLGGQPQPDLDIYVLATPEMAGLADWIVAFVAAGGLAAALSTASGLLLVISSSVAHDLYFRVLNPRATEKQRLLIGRIVIGVAVVIAGYFGINPPGFVGEVVAFAFGLAAASFFPAIVLGIFSKRVSTVPAMAGMILGLSFTALYIVGNTLPKILPSPAAADALLAPTHFLRTPWFFGINPQGIGTVGMALNFLITLALTPFFPPPDETTQQLIDSVREPEGSSPAVHIDAALH